MSLQVRPPAADSTSQRCWCFRPGVGIDPDFDRPVCAHHLSEAGVSAVEQQPAMGYRDGVAYDIAGAYSICTTCGDLRSALSPFDRGAVEPVADECDCGKVFGQPFHAVLCRTCGLAVVDRYRNPNSALVCQPCFTLARDFNARSGWPMVPRTYHDVPGFNMGVHEPAYNPMPSPDPWAQAERELGDRFQVLHRWGQQLVLDRLVEMSFTRPGVIPLEQYLLHCANHGIERRTGWQLLDLEFLTAR